MVGYEGLLHVSVPSCELFFGLKRVLKKPDLDVKEEGITEASKLHSLVSKESAGGPRVVACIPAWNEASSIGSVIVSARKYVDQVYVCDDGSTDVTAELSEALGAHVIRHERNMGYGASLISLFKVALEGEADYVVTLDADSQHDPSEIPILIAAIRKKDVDIVIGSRFVEGAETEAPGWRNFGIKMINYMSQNGFDEVSDSQSGFRVYSRKALSSLNLTEDGMGVSTEILVKAGNQGLRIAEVPIHVEYKGRTSHHNPILQGFKVSLSSLKHISIYHPLAFYGVPGVTALILSLIFWVIALTAYASSNSLPTNPVLLAIGSMMIGLILAVTGIILWVLTTLITEQSKLR